MKYLLQMIEGRREAVRMNNRELVNLMQDIREGRDEKEDFLENLERVITELRNYTEHSTAFLQRVSKREAPDYYDVIRQPMDLGTMQKKIKAAAYKNKEQFARDLNLIWSNCLRYNSDLAHPLRKHAAAMKKKADHLLEFVPDNPSSSFKDALGGFFSNLDLDVDLGYGAGNEDGNARGQAGPSSLPAQRAVENGNVDMMDERTETIGERPGRPTGTVVPKKRARSGDVVRGGANGLVNGIEPGRIAGGADEGWWDALQTEEMLGSGPASISGSSVVSGPGSACLPACPRWPSVEEIEAAMAEEAEVAERRRKRLKRPKSSARIKDKGKGKEVVQNGMETGRPGLQGLVARNIATVRKLQRTNSRFLGLAAAMAHDQRPSVEDLASSESDDPPSAAEEDLAGPALHGPGRPPDPFGPGARPPLPRAHARISSKQAYDELRHKNVELLAHAGFEGSGQIALDVLTEVGAEFLKNLGRTLRFYSDRFAKKMSPEEIILHVLYENDQLSVRSLESYIRDDVERYGNKMAETLRRLKARLKEQVQRDREAIADDMLFSKDGEAMISGQLGAELGEDFFGLGALGLDKELGLSMLNIPARLWSGHRPDGGVPGAGPSGPGGVPGAGGAHQGSAAEASGGTGERPPLAYEPPPPYVPLSAGAIQVQIGLLRPYYQERLRRRAKAEAAAAARKAEPGKGEDECETGAGAGAATSGGESGGGGAQGNAIDAAKSQEGAGAEGGAAASDQAAAPKRSATPLPPSAPLEVPEDDADRAPLKAKVPPTGRLPRRKLATVLGFQPSFASQTGAGGGA